MGWFTTIDDNTGGDSGGTGAPVEGSWEGILRAGGTPQWETWPNIRYAKKH
jgi:hypothetical protein